MKTKAELQQLLRKCSKERLQDFILLLALEDKYINQRLALYFGEMSMSGNSYKILIAQQLNQFRDSKGYIHYDFLFEISNYFSRMISTLFKGQNYLELAQFLPCLVVELNRELLEVDDSYGCFGDMLQECIEDIFKIIDRGDTQVNQIIYKSVRSALDDKDIYAFDFGHDFWKVISYLVDDNRKYLDFMQIMDAKIKRCEPGWISHYNEMRKLEAQVKCLENLGELDERRIILSLNRNMIEMRRILIQDEVDCGNIDEAFILIDEGLEEARARKNEGDASFLEKMRMELVQHFGGADSKLLQARKMITVDPFDMKYFLLTKEYTREEDWPVQRAEIIQELKENDHSLMISHLQEIYYKERMWPELIISLQSGQHFYSLDRYAEELIKYDRDELVRLYLEGIKRFAAINVGRKYYKVLARYLRKLEKWGASDEVSAVVRELRKTYPLRTAMLEELSGF